MEDIIQKSSLPRRKAAEMVLQRYVKAHSNWEVQLVTKNIVNVP